MGRLLELETGTPWRLVFSRILGFSSNFLASDRKGCKLYMTTRYYMDLNFLSCVYGRLVPHKLE